MNAQATETAFFVGQPVEWQGFGWVADIQEADGPQSFTIGAQGMQANRLRLSIVWESGDFSTDTPEHIAAPWIKAAARAKAEPKPAAECLAMLEAAKAKRAAFHAEQAAEREAHAAKVSAWRDEIRGNIPADAKAVIVAELEHDASDTMTDYFNTQTSRCVILGFSRHTRDLFAEMRKAAARLPETAHLENAPEDAEHREKWSMGAGYYLKASGRYSDGWKVLKRALYQRGNDIAEAMPYGEWMVPDGAPYVTGNAPRSSADAGAAEPDAQLPAEIVGRCTICPRTHDKKGFKMWIVCLPDRVERAEFDKLLSFAKSSRGWYSRKWGDSPAGFAFKDADAARAFAGKV